MYYMYMGTMQIPIPPEELKTKIGSRNKTINLLGKGEVNVLRSAALTEISFKFMLPNSKYPFSQQIVKGMVASLFGIADGMAPSILDCLEEMKASLEPFQFIMVRMKQDGSYINSTNMRCILEDYSILESAGEGYDMYASVTLKKWKDYGTKKIVVSTDANGTQKGTVVQKRPTLGSIALKGAMMGAARGILSGGGARGAFTGIFSGAVGAAIQSTVSSYVAKDGETLSQSLRRVTGKAATVLGTMNVAKLNRIAIPGVLAAGQIINRDRESETPANALKMKGVVMH